MKTAVAAPARLGEALLEARRLTPQQLQSALDEQSKATGERLGEILIRLGYVSEDDITECLANQYGLPVVRLNRYLVDHAILEAFPQRFLEKNEVCPMFRVEDTTTVAIADPTNIFVLDEIQRLVSGRVQAVLASPSNIRDALRLRTNLADAFGIDDIVDGSLDAEVQLVEEQTSELDQLEDASGLSPVVRLVNYLLFRAVQDGASDIHIEVDDEQMRVRNRVDGILREVLTPPRALHAALVSRVKIMANLDISERRLPQDGRMRVVFERRPIDLRVSTVPCHHGEKVVIRILDQDSMLVDLEGIGVNRDLLQRIDAQVRRPNGLVLVTGPTGSGKSTTLYSMLNRIKDPGVNICSAEDPVEFNIRGINQIQVNEKIGMTFPVALRALLRQDPDVIMVGEIRDRETAATAVQASLTGHLVLATLHTNDAPSAITRLTNMEVEPYLLAASLQAVLAQRLVRKICAECREPARAGGAAAERLKAAGFDADRLYVGKGCPKCRSSGYSGRIGLFELLCLDDAIRELVIGRASVGALRECARRAGMRSLLDDGIAKVAEGITSAEEVLRVTE